MADPLSRFRSFPKNPLQDVSAVHGNVSDEQKQLNLNALHYFSHGGFGSNAAKGLRLVEANVKPVRTGSESSSGGQKQSLQGETICEIDVTEAMLNRFDTVAGACIMHLFDITTLSALFTLGFALGIDLTGVSYAMDVQWHSPGRRGMTLSILSKSMTIGGNICAARAEMFDRKTGRLLAAAVHSIAPLKRAISKAKL